MNKISRRKFIGLAGIGIGAAVAGGAGLRYLATRGTEPDGSLVSPTAIRSKSKEQKVLIAYSSRLGSTAEVANVIGEALVSRGAQVNVRSADALDSVAGYDAVVIGSAVRRARWLPDATSFLERNAQAFESLPVSFFTVCMTMSSATPENRSQALTFSREERVLLKPQQEECFGGRLEYSRLSSDEQSMLKAMNVPEGDFRDWNAIREWASGIPLG